MTSLENIPVKYSDLVSEIETGQVKIPQFQRKFVWGIKASAKLLDSIIKGYPIGTFIYWRTNERLRSIRNLGNIMLPEPKEGEYINYVLDGQQRLTSLFASLKGVQITDDDGKIFDYSKIFVDLTANEDGEIIVTDITDMEPNTFIKVTELMEGSLTMLASFPEKYHSILEQYKKIIQSYTFSVINLKNAPIDVATEVFTRLNVGGKALTLFEIMVAKTYDAKEEFDLSEKYDQLKEELSISQYDTIPSSTVLQVVAILLEKDCTRKQILKLEKQRFIDIWNEATDCIKKSVDFFRGYGIVVSRILPYNALIVPFSYFFYLHKKNPIGSMKKRLEDFFWRASLGFRYSSGVESKIAQDIEKIEAIINGELPKYGWAVTIDEEYIENNGWFSTGKAFVKAILCLYAKQKPKSFDNNLDVIMDNSWLKIASSKNYHHYFPKSWLKKEFKDWDYFYVNHIVNITIVDDFLNKRTIKTKSPGVYMKTFQKHNDELENTMKSHLIDIAKDGVWDNDYDKFYRARLKRISKALNKFIIPQESLSETPLEVYEDIEEPEIEGIE
ncbi:hypothetical protein LZ24_01620 [Desulfobotulus alkaliphilus]|uniref:GmrSD restriction endonucleases N-terminal domain-containing protein n=1 Tax=Desulfobotulus alkaliphilus TaxID=622671 RepID=A0A562RUP5_9BACT|nr:DUF262 domain-containing protein [Desulfobotulus alkaliphilus]TWI72214.1 hypothetical protein LZ24_01620 [Desulfobotulus alkaliphilus]